MTDRATRIDRLADTQSMPFVAEALFRGDDWSRAMAPGYLGRVVQLKIAETRAYEAYEAMRDAPITPAEKAKRDEDQFFAPGEDAVDDNADVIRAYLAARRVGADNMLKTAQAELDAYVAQIADRRPDIRA